MAVQTNIEWADSTFNPWIGCTKVGPGCDHCYAATMDARKVFQGVTHWGAGVPRQRTSDANWMQAHKWNDKPFYECADCHWRGDKPETAGTKLTDGLHSCPECDSLNLIEARRRVFCASLADVFDNEVPQEWRYDLFNLILSTPNLDWLLVTKRIGNVQRMLNETLPESIKALPAGHPLAWPWPHVWLGITVVNQAEADRDIPKLLEVDASVRFLSMEPLLGAIDLSRVMLPDGDSLGQGLFSHGAGAGIDWVIVGGESGPESRPMHPDWARSLRDQCQVAGVPFLFKQWGEHTSHDIDPNGLASHLVCIDAMGKDCAMSRSNLNEPWWFLPPWPGRSTWGPDGLQPGVVEIRRVGKKAAGRLLDGNTHTEFPEAA